MLRLEADFQGGRKESSANASIFLFFLLCVVAWQRQRWEEEHSGAKVSHVLQIFMVLMRTGNDQCTMKMKWNESDVRNRFLLFQSWPQRVYYSLWHKGMHGLAYSIFKESYGHCVLLAFK